MSSPNQAPVGAADRPDKLKIVQADDMDVSEQENAVGYREYLEALDVEPTEREVSA
jgi:hypothetical protein